MVDGSVAVLFRVDASPSLGTGHLARCVTLAKALRARGASIVFACGGDPATYENMTAFADPGALHHVPALGQEDDAEWTVQLIDRLGGVSAVVVDHYSLAAPWETVASSSAPVAVIDDLADRTHQCRLLLDQNLYRDMDVRYDGLVPAGCRLLLGPRFTLLRAEFTQAAAHAPQRDGAIHTVLVSYGGSDPTQETLKALTALAGIRSVERIDVVAGQAMQVSEATRAAIDADPRILLHVAPQDMAALMSDADLSLGAGGSTSWERCLLGLPAIVTAVAQNQIDATETLADTGAVLYAGSYDTVSAATLSALLRELAADPQRVRRMSVSARAVMKDHEGADQVASAILEVARARS